MDNYNKLLDRNLYFHISQLLKALFSFFKKKTETYNLFLSAVGSSQNGFNLGKIQNGINGLYLIDVSLPLANFPSRRLLIVPVHF